MRQGIFLDTGYRDGRFNMELDEWLLLRAEEENLPPVLRVYGWQPPAVSIGFFQSLEETVDLKRCQQFGVEVVRRPTGGRAILHLDDFTYSFVVREEEVGAVRGLTGTYLLISQALVEGLRRLGVEARLERGKIKGQQLFRGGPCFASISRYEIEVGGRKLVGSAQRRMGRAILQHGSIPLRKRELSITELLPSKSGQLRGTNLSESLDREMGFDEVKLSIRRGFERIFGLEFIPYTWEEFSPHLESLSKAAG